MPTLALAVTSPSKLSLQDETTCQGRKPKSCQEGLLGVAGPQGTRVCTDLGDSVAGYAILTGAL